MALICSTCVSARGPVGRIATSHRDAPSRAVVVGRAMPSSISNARPATTTADALPDASIEAQMGRREALLAFPALALAMQAAGAAGAEEEIAEATSGTPEKSKKTKVVVLGGNGFVGSRVSKLLVQAGCEVSSVSRSGTPPSWASKEDWVSGVTWTKGDVLNDDLSAYLNGADAVVSCIGVIGGSYKDMEVGNGAVNAAAAQKSKAAGVPTFVYVSVASIVPNSVSGIVGGTDFKGYFDGKKEAEAAITEAYPHSSLIVKPSFIYGGSDFALTPPRVASGYGSAIEGLLSSSPIHALANVMPGPIALTLEPPVSVDNVAAAAVGGAVGFLQAGAVDGTEAINLAASEYIKSIAA